MTSYKLYNTLLLSLSLTLTGCAKSGDDDTETTTETVTETTTPEGTLSLANPIADMTLIADTALNFSIPENTCVHTTGESINYSMSLANNAGFILTNFTQLTGKPTELGVVSITVTCSTTAETFTDEFTITVVDFEADPVVEINTPAVAKYDEVLTLTAVAQDVNLSGSIASYSWKVTSDATIVLINDDTSTVSFTVPDTPTQTAATLEVTVTDNDGNTATDTVEIDLISSNAPDVSLSFPLALGVYNEDKIDMFGYAGFNDPHNLATVTVAVNVDGIDHDATVTDSTWRLLDVTITDNSEIKVVATSSTGFINYEAITLVNDLYETSIDANISDIAVSESTGDIYVHSDGALSSDLHITKFNLDTAESEELIYTKDATYGDDSRTSIATDSNNLYLSSANAITKIDLSTNIETVLSDATTGTGSGAPAPEFIIELGYYAEYEILYYLDKNQAQVNSASPDSGDRNFLTATEFATNPTSVIANLSTSKIFYSKGTTTTDEAVIYADPFDPSYGKNAVAIYTVQSTANGGNGAPISDFALNGTGDELYFIDGSGDLIKLDVSDITVTATATTVVENLFSVESIVDENTPLIGLHYDITRNVIIAAGRDADGTNKLLVIDPVSGDYGKVATGTVD